MGVIGSDADPVVYPGCVEAPGSKTANAIYSQKYPNTTRPAASGGPAKSLGLSSGKVHLTVAFQAWKITNGSNNEIEVRLQNSDAHRMISVRVQQHKVSGTPVDNQLRFVGVTYNGTAGGAQKTAGLFPVGSENTTPMVLGATIDLDADTWEFWTDAPGTTAGLASTNAGLSGTFPTANSILDQTVDAMTIMVKGNNGTDDYFIIDQIKVSGPDYTDTVSQTASFKEFDKSLLRIYPNPADNFISIENLSVDSKVELINVVGKKIKSFKIESQNQKLDINDLNRGLYFVKVDDKSAAKFIKR